jgi:hypothetical protein
MAGELGAASFLPAGLGVVAGGIQALIGGIKQHKATKALESLKTPGYTPNKAINDYYQTAMGRYNVNPYQSNEYQYAQKQANKALGTGIGALQDRRNSLAGVAGLVNATENNMNRASVNAQAQQNAAFAGLGSATGMKAGDDKMAWQQNVLAPYQKQSRLLEMKAAAGGQMLNAGLSNISGGLNNAAMLTTAQSGGGGGMGATSYSHDPYPANWNVASYGGGQLPPIAPSSAKNIYAGLQF